MSTPRDRLVRLDQPNPYVSAWSFGMRIKIVLRQIVQGILFRPTFKQLRPWRVLLLRCFGAKIDGRCYVASSAIIKMPWNLVMENNACLGPCSECYNLAPITLRARATVAQHAYLCAGTHDLNDPALPLVVGPIDIGADAFIGAKALLLPGVVVGAGGVVGAGAVVAKDVEPWTIVAGNPAKVIGKREGHHNARSEERRVGKECRS